MQLSGDDTQGRGYDIAMEEFHKQATPEHWALLTEAEKEGFAIGWCAALCAVGIPVSKWPSHEGSNWNPYTNTRSDD